MTDNEIVKALEELRKEQENGYVTALEFGGKRDEAHEWFLDLLGETIDFINRQKAEIERLRDYINDKLSPTANLIRAYDIKNAKAEAIKEFSEEVLKEIQDAILSNDRAIRERVERHNANRYDDDLCILWDGKITALGGIRCFIVNLLEEMVGDNNAE